MLYLILDPVLNRYAHLITAFSRKSGFAVQIIGRVKAISVIANKHVTAL